MPDYSDIFDILKQDEEESKDENDSNDIFDILKEGDKKEPENTDLEPDNVSLDLPEIKHATTEQMSEGVSWLQAEGDFVKV